MFDDENIYVAARCWDSAPPDKWIANEMRRDANQIRQNDHFGVMLDTFHDRRNGYVFYTNPLGGRIDLTEPTKATRTPTGIRCGTCGPAGSRAAGRSRWRFRSSRCATSRARTRPGAFRCAAPIRRKNEWDHLDAAADRRWAARRASSASRRRRRSSASTCRRPAATSSSSRTGSRGSRPTGLRRRRVDNDPTATSASTRSTASPRISPPTSPCNTDFAQVEVDEQQVNLTRFNLLFPEKREFFLEGRGIFTFAPIPEHRRERRQSTRPTRRRSSTAAGSA